MNHAYYQTPLGMVDIGYHQDMLCALRFCDAAQDDHAPTSFTDLVAEQLVDYCNGERTTFHLPLNPQGTPFQHQVWQALRDIPYGETRTYGQIATAIGNPKAARAVGMANNRNPIMVVIPCHRVIGAKGDLVGYAGGLPLKERLLSLEKHKKTFINS